MEIHQAVFVASSTKVTDKPKDKHPEFAFIGRSNVGKSSFINCLCNRKYLAKTSSTPGKTQCINHFLVNDSWYIVDLPGYGYARLSHTMRDKIDKMIKDYILNSEEMTLLFVLLDSRHDILKNDLEFLLMLGENGIPFSIIFTKSDKLGKNALTSQIEKNKRKLLEYWEELPPIFVTSSHSNSGREDVLKYIRQILKSITNN